VIVQATWPNMLEVCLGMRADDRREVMATRWSDDPFDFAADCMRLPGTKLAALLPSGEAVAVGGVAVHQPGIGQAWMVGTERIGELGVEIAHASKKGIKALFERGGVHRIQAHSAAFHSDAHRWLKAIGLRKEATLPKYGKGGEDFFIFSAVKGD